MKNIFAKIGAQIKKSPFKILFITITVFAIMISGAIKVNMATGSETLVQVDNEAYINNFIMEENFGGDAIMILVKGEQEELLSLANLEKLWNIEQRLKYNENIFTIMSPSSVVHQITDKQTSEIKNQIENMHDGLATLAVNLAKISNELGSKDLPDIASLDDALNDVFAGLDFESLLKDMMSEKEAELSSQFTTMANGLKEMGTKLTAIAKQFATMDIPDTAFIEAKLLELDNITVVFDQLITGQNNLESNIIDVGNNLATSSNGLATMAQEINTLSNSLSDDALKERLLLLATNLSQNATGIANISSNTNNLADGNKNTAFALNGIKTNLTGSLNEIKLNLNAGVSKDELLKMSSGLNEMGNKLIEISTNLNNKLTGESLFEVDDKLLSQLKNQMSTELAKVKGNLSFDIDPSEFQQLASGFSEMSVNLLKMSNGLEMFNEKSNMLIANFPHNQPELDNILFEDNQLREIFNDTIIDENHILMLIKLEGNVEDKVIDSVYADVLQAVESENLSLEYLISGKPVLDSALRAEMKANMLVMVAAAVALMFIILALVFKVRWRILSLAIIFISVIATLGLMGHFNVSMTMVSMAVFPILIGLGIDYSIQFHNRYEEELSTEITLRQIGKSVGIAVLATVLGFSSLFISPVPMIQDFGKMLTIGVIVSFIGSIFLLMPTLRARDLVAEKADTKTYLNNNNENFIDKLLQLTEKFVVKFAYVIVIIALGLSIFGFCADTKIGVETDIETFMPQDMQALSDIHYIRDAVGSTNQMVLYLESTEMFSQTNIDYQRSLVETLKTKYSDKIVDIKSIDNVISNFNDLDSLNQEQYLAIIENDIPKNQRKMFVNNDLNKAVIIMNVEHMATEELQLFVESIRQEITDAPLAIEITGKSVLDIEMVKGLTDGRMQMTALGLSLVFIVLLIIYRSITKALIAIVPVALIVGMSGGVMNLLNLKYTPITATLGALVLGMGTEMTIMLLERYLEERPNKTKAEALTITMKNIGKATVASGLTTVGGFSVLMLSKFVILKDFGLMTVINITLALIATFVILPALIWIFDGFLVKKK